MVICVYRKHYTQKSKQLNFSLVVEYSASFSNMSVVRRNFLERFIILKLGEFVYKFYSYLEVELVVIFRTDFNWFRSYLYISLLINEYDNLSEK